jgi:hypothetical protein
MAGGVVIHGTTDVARIEAPVTVKAYLICAFAAFGGIFFGYDTGWMSGVMACLILSPNTPASLDQLLVTGLL